MDWFSYDAIADHYATVAEPLYFADPARDLVSLLALQAGERLLDVGSGSGARWSRKPSEGRVRRGDISDA